LNGRGYDLSFVFSFKGISFYLDSGAPKNVCLPVFRRAISKEAGVIPSLTAGNSFLSSIN
jgi:hypothetical protein